MTRGTQEIARDWLRAKEHLVHAQRLLNEAQDTCDRYGNELGASLAPPDMELCEKVAVWCRYSHTDRAECLVQVEKIQEKGAVCSEKYIVCVRAERTGPESLPA